MMIMSNDIQADAGARIIRREGLDAAEIEKGKNEIKQVELN